MLLMCHGQRVQHDLNPLHHTSLLGSSRVCIAYAPHHLTPLSSFACTQDKHHIRVIMGNVWAKKPLKEVMRENKRMINRAVRELDREKVNLEKNEKKLVADIKKYAKENQMVRPHHEDISSFTLMILLTLER